MFIYEAYVSCNTEVVLP